MSALAITFTDNIGVRLIIGMIAWFAQMGFHEGGHAWAAWKLGDDTAYLQGKRTVNPFAHINWNQPFSVISTVVAPAITSIVFLVPLGMAWVPVNPGKFRHPARDHAIVAFAGPAGGFVVALVAFLIYFALYKVVETPDPSLAQQLLGQMLIMIYLTAVVYSIFNLIPIPPLDGSNIAYYFGNRQLRELMDKIRAYGFLIIVLVFWIAIPDRYIGAFVGWLVWPFVQLPPMVWGA